VQLEAFSTEGTSSGYHPFSRHTDLLAYTPERLTAYVIVDVEISTKTKQTNNTGSVCRLITHQK